MLWCSLKCRQPLELVAVHAEQPQKRKSNVSIPIWVLDRQWSCWNDQESSLWVISSSSLLFAWVIQSLCHCHSPLPLFLYPCPFSFVDHVSSPFPLLSYSELQNTRNLEISGNFKFVISRPRKGDVKVIAIVNVDSSGSALHGSLERLRFMYTSNLQF